MSAEPVQEIELPVSAAGFNYRSGWVGLPVVADFSDVVADLVAENDDGCPDEAKTEQRFMETEDAA